MVDKNPLVRVVFADKKQRDILSSKFKIFFDDKERLYVLNDNHYLIGSVEKN